MNEVAKALRESIASWEAHANEPVGARVEKHGSDNCALCHLFNSDDTLNEDDCIGCPVWIKTGISYCRNTPYAAYTRVARMDEKGYYTVSQSSQRAAQAELEFLRSLEVPDEQV